MAIAIEQIKRILEAAIMTAVEPVSLERLSQLFPDGEAPSHQELRSVLQTLEQDYLTRGITLVKVASGYRFQVATDVANHLATWMEEAPARFSRALLETLALIAYKQPITRAEIEEIRGVSVSTNILRNLQEREWIKIVGQKDVPGKPALYATTPQFLNDLNLQSITQLPALLNTHEEEGAEQLALELALEAQLSSQSLTEQPLNVSLQTEIADDSELPQLQPVSDQETPNPDE